MFAFWANAQTTIAAGTTVNASTITAGNSITINAAGTLNMDVTKVFGAISTSNLSDQTTAITGAGILTCSSITLNAVNAKNSQITISSATTVICSSITTLAGNPSSGYNITVSGILKNSGTTNLKTLTCNIGSTVEYNGAGQTVFSTI